MLGLDVSPKRMGWGLVDLLTGEPIACGMESLDLPSAGWAHQQAARALGAVTLHQSTYEFPTINETAASIESRIGRPPRDVRGEIQAVYIEQPALPPVSGTKSAYSAGRAVQAVHGEVERRWPWADIQYLQPGEWRKLAGLPGNASKADVMTTAVDAMYRATGVLHTNVETQDAADALLIALAGQRRNADTWERSGVAA